MARGLGLQAQGSPFERRAADLVQGRLRSLVALREITRPVSRGDRRAQRSGVRALGQGIIGGRGRTRGRGTSVS